MTQEQASQRYTSPDGWFAVDLPARWQVQPEEGESTTIFFDPEGTGGTLRVTALAITGPEGEPANMAAVLAERWKEQERPEGYEGNFTDRQGAVRYDQALEEDGIQVRQRFWELAQGNVLLVFHYTQEASKWQDSAGELETATEIVGSLQFLR